MESIKVFLQCIVLAAVLILAFMFWQERKERIRFQTNMENLIQSNSDELLLTKKEIKELYPSIKKFVDSVGIKIRNVTNYITTDYHIKDTMIKSYEVHDYTLTGVKSFDIKEGCWSLSGQIYPDTIMISKKEFADKLTTILYKDYRKHLWFVKWDPYYTAKVFSKCLNDTVSITKNIKIKK